MSPVPNMLWVDLETTGLDPKEHQLLEVAAVITDSDLNELIVENFVIHQDLLMSDMAPAALSMHTANGLIYDVVHSLCTLEKAQNGLISLMQMSELWPDSDVKPPLCGSSINFERNWLSVWMPEFYEYIHYRSVDVSTIKELMTRWMPNEAISRRDTSEHRALADIRDSIEELRHYRSVLWKQPSVLV